MPTMPILIARARRPRHPAPPRPACPTGSGRRDRVARAAPAAAIAYHTAPCSPHFDIRATARSSTGPCPRVRSARRSSVSRLSAAEPDALLLGIEPDEDHLRQVHEDGGVLGGQLVPA